MSILTRDENGNRAVTLGKLSVATIVAAVTGVVTLASFFEFRPADVRAREKRITAIEMSVQDVPLLKAQMAELSRELSRTREEMADLRGTLEGLHR